MSSSNVMEVITKGSYMYDASESITEPCRSATSQSTRTESQLSLEYLPPEAPYYGNITTTLQPTEDSSSPQESDPDDAEEEEQMEEATSELYKRIQALSEQIHSELVTMEDVESTTSHLPTPVPDCTSTDVVDGRTFLSELDASRDSTVVAESELLDSSLSLDSEVNDCRDLVCYSDCHNTGSSSRASDQVAPRDCGSNLSSASRDPLLTHTDPKLKKALEKMRKLDEKLADLDKKEKEVKKQRRLLEQQMETDQGQVHASSVHSLDRDAYTPVFATQLNDNASTAGDSTSDRDTVKESSKSSELNKRDTEKEDDKGSKPKKQSEISGTNFIKRNIELASEAGALVAMTEAEKHRLDELLAGEDQTEDDSDDDAPLRICARDTSEGFLYEEQDLDRMKRIDSQLQAILPPDDWESISCSSRNQTATPTSHQPGIEEETDKRADSTETSVPEGGLNKATHIVPGEEVLHQFQMSRAERERLRTIDERLSAIQDESQQPHLPLPASDLHSLLEQYRDCVTSEDTQVDSHEAWGIHTNEETDSPSHISSNMALYNM